MEGGEREMSCLRVQCREQGDRPGWDRSASSKSKVKLRVAKKSANGKKKEEQKKVVFFCERRKGESGPLEMVSAGDH